MDCADAFAVSTKRGIMANQLIILDSHDRTLYTDVTLKLKRIDIELSKLQKGIHTKHKMHADAVLHFTFVDLCQIEARSRDIRNKRLRIELRKEVLRRRELYYEIYDSLYDTLYLG